MEKTQNRVILSTAYLPNIQYFTKLINGKVILEQHENFVKQTYRNRCEILTANGVMPLIIPIKHLGTKIPVRDVKIDYTDNWQRLHWRALVAAYRSSPFFEYYEDDFVPFYEKKIDFLYDYNFQLLQLLIELTGIKTDIVFSESYITEKNPDTDFRMSITPKANKPVDSSFFPAPYYQVFNDRSGFAPNLSIFDLLCNEGNNTYSILLNSIS